MPALFFFSALLVTNEQHEAVRNQRQIELQQRQELFKWGDDPFFTHLPGYLKAETKTLPKDVQFTQEGLDDLHKARRKALGNLGLVMLLDIFDSWDSFDDYRKVKLVLVLSKEYVVKNTCYLSKKRDCNSLNTRVHCRKHIQVMN